MESKVVYEKDGKIRSLRGEVSFEDDFIIVHRRNKEVRINKKLVQFIEKKLDEDLESQSPEDETEGVYKFSEKEKEQIEKTGGL